MASATVLATVRSSRAPVPTEKQGVAIRRVRVAGATTLHASAATVPGKRK